MGSYGNQPQKCIICTNPHKIEDHQYAVIRYKKDKGKICIHVIPKCANCTRAYATNFSRCILTHKAEITVRKEKKTKEIEKEKEEACNNANEVEEKEKKASLQLNTDMELEEK